jgi:hypothetical protein
MRQHFGDWGSELSDADFACALAAAGMLPPEAEPSWPVDRLAAEIKDRLGRGVAWRLNAQAARFDPRVLAEAWLLLLGFREALRIKIDPEGLSSLPRAWLEEQLSRPEVGASARIAIFKGSYAVEVDEPRMRFLQAQLQNQDRTYLASIRVGLPERRWQSVEKPFPLPENTGQEGHELTVLFWEPRVSPEPQVESLWLPPQGNSKPVSFAFEVPEGVESIAARITVVHANRVLQTGVLRAPMDGSSPWTFGLDATPRTVLEDLSGRTTFDAALVLNHDGEGIPRLTAAADGKAAVIALDDGPLEDLTRFLARQISKAASDPDSYAQLDSPGSVELLRTLAQKGGSLHETLCNHTELAVLANAKRIHLTSAKPGSFFPIELLYSFEPPDETAGLCPDAAEALQKGECPGGCSVDRRQNVCPLGFWGLSRIIERHAHQIEDNRMDGDFLLQPEPVRKRSPLPISGKSLLAASGRASEVKATAVDDLFAALQKRGPAHRADTWKDWTSEVGSTSPSLLILLPHHEQSPDEEILEIGESDRLKSELVRIDHVRRQPDGPYPILLLLGCETNLARIAFDNFVTRFRDKGASVVVSTIATVLGRHASPAAGRLVELLDEEAAEGNSTFGEIMLRLRRKLMATQTPMALGLTAYGDADWVLTKGGG